MSGYSYDADAIKKKFADQQKQVGSTGGSRLKTYKLNTPNKQLHKLKILPPAASNQNNVFVKEVIIHQLWGFDPETKKRRLEAETVGPKMSGKDDPIMIEGFKLRKKFADSKNKTLKDLWKLYMPKTNRYVNILDLDNLNAGAQPLLLPNSAYNKISDVMMGISSGDEDDEFVNVVTNNDMLSFDKTKILLVKHNGKTGKEIRYEANFSTKAVNLESKIDINKVMNEAVDLDKFEPALNENKVKEYLTKINQKVEDIIEREGGDLIDDNIQDEDIQLEEFSDDSGSSNDDFDID